MTLDNLKEAIFTAADQRALKLRAQSEAVQADERQRIARQAQQLEEDIISQAEATAAREAARLHQSARLEAKAAVLAIKQAELNQLQAAVNQQIINWPEEAVAPLLTRFIALLPGDGHGSIVPGARHSRLVKKIAQENHFKVAATEIPDEGGFIYRSPNEDINFTVSYLVSQVFNQHRAAIAKALLG